MILGISKAGNEAEREFSYLTGASPSDCRKNGDRILENHYIEIKDTTQNTVNQVRPIKCIPLVVRYNKNLWYVFNPREQIEAASKKKRGQHGESPFENCTLSLSKFSKNIVDKNNLKEKVLEAVYVPKSLSDLMLSHKQNLEKEHCRIKVELEKVIGNSIAQS